MDGELYLGPREFIRKDRILGNADAWDVSVRGLGNRIARIGYVGRRYAVVSAWVATLTDVAYKARKFRPAIASPSPAYVT